MSTQGQVRVGTSGWSYDHWDGRFYPEDLPASERLGTYAAHFDTVEINATFYRLPGETTVTRWRETVPGGFVFSVKGSRYITHVRRLKNVSEETERFLTRVGGLGPTLGVVLWQLPPQLQADPGLLERFVAALPEQGPRHAVEFRHRSWLTPEVFSVLDEHGVATVNVDSDAMPADRTVTGGFGYVRFHGTAAHGGSYPRRALEPWAEFLAEQRDMGRDCYVYFNNDWQAHAPKDAARLIGMLSE